MKSGVKIAVYLILGFTALNLLAYLASLAINNNQVKDFAEQLGFWAWLFIVIGIVLGGVFVPLSALPFLFVGLGLYGFWPTFILYYIGNTVIAPITDFWIARRYGRPVVVKLAGKKTLEQIDKIAKVVGWQTLAVLRFFGGILFDSISYAVGLSTFSFRRYVLLTLTLPIPGMLLSLHFIQQGMTTSPLYLGLIVFWGYTAGALTMYYVLKKRKGFS